MLCLCCVSEIFCGSSDRRWRLCKVPFSKRQNRNYFTFSLSSIAETFIVTMTGPPMEPITTLYSSNVALYGESKLTGYVVFVAILAASGGLLFGYDLGVTGGVESMESFQKQFFPSVYESEQNFDGNSPYCTYNSATLQFFTSVLFLAGLIASPFAGWFTKRFGRLVSMFIASVSFLIGSGLNAGAQNLAMLYVGRIFLGIGIGFANSSVPLYLSETAPFKYRGALNQLFQLSTTIGILVAQLINYGIRDWDEGWRLSLGLAAVPALILLFGCIILPESPNSLCERKQETKAKEILQRLRGGVDVDGEMRDIIEATKLSEKVTMKQSWKIMCTRRYLPQFITTLLIPLFQQLTGINAIMFYVPVLFRSLGKGAESALLNTVIVGAVNVVATLVAIFTVDRLGRRFWFMEGGMQMLASMITTAVVLAVEFSKYPDGVLPSGTAIGVLVVICVFVAAFAWSWGPLGWLVPSEIQTLETRAAGMSSAVFINFLLSFIIGQTFVSMLCAMEWGVFLFFAGWVAIMSTFVFFFVPETKGVPVEKVQILFARHKIWRKLMGHHADDILEEHRNAKLARKEHGMESAAAAGEKKDIDDDDLIETRTSSVWAPAYDVPNPYGPLGPLGSGEIHAMVSGSVTLDPVESNHSEEEGTQADPSKISADSQLNK